MSDLSPSRVVADAGAALGAIGVLRDRLKVLSIAAPKALGVLELELYRVRYQASQAPLKLELGAGDSPFES